MIPLLDLTPISHPVLDTFLLGAVCAMSFAAALFFLRFWRNTHDFLFLAFAGFFAIEGANSAYIAMLPHPNVGNFSATLIRLLAVVGILCAIIWKNLMKP